MFVLLFRSPSLFVFPCLITPCMVRFHVLVLKFAWEAVMDRKLTNINFEEGLAAAGISDVEITQG